MTSIQDTNGENVAVARRDGAWSFRKRVDAPNIERWTSRVTGAGTTATGVISSGMLSIIPTAP